MELESFTMTNVYRCYTAASNEDNDNIDNGRCPDYALCWGKQNESHWADGHDYFIGTNVNFTSDENQILREILSDKLKNGEQTNTLLFCDLDGVLADFEQGVNNKFTKPSNEIHSSLMWKVINNSKSFFETLPWMPRGKELWDRIKHRKPIILTGVPKGSKTGAEQKRKWCADNLGQHIKVITCATKEKPNYCLPNSILIDDRPDNLNAWNLKGGKFILYDEEFVDITVERINRHMDDDGFKSP